MDGVIVLDKPTGISSHDAVQKMRRLTGVRRIGHLGTLDPLGSGVLPMVIGKATRLSQFYLGHDREYVASVRFGFATSTYDSQGEQVGEAVEPALSADDVEQALCAFRGRISQKPPPVSAKKVNGVPAYKLARRHQEVDLQPVELDIYELALLRFEADVAQIRMRTSAGAYVRSLAHDLGRALGCGGHVTALRRVAMGEFGLEQALSFEQLQDLADGGDISNALVPAARLLPEFPAHRVDSVAITRIGHGMDFQITAFGDAASARRIKALDSEGSLLAIADIRLPRTYHPIIVF
ncbi:MAG: tRNA pseudouridine(55) synthase TruB [Acidobacteria bacterium]|nr:tRNA pseudouridine(55) synthase TruB [Acidobacteriota bacterium]